MLTIWSHSIINPFTPKLKSHFISFHLFGSPQISLDLENITYKTGKLSGEGAEKETRGLMIYRLPHYNDAELQI